MLQRLIFLGLFSLESISISQAQQVDPAPQMLRPNDTTPTPRPSSSTELPPIEIRNKEKSVKNTKAVRKKNQGRTQADNTRKITAGNRSSQSNETTAAEGIIQQDKTLDTARDNDILAKVGANTYPISHDDIERRPQGDNAPLEKVLLQTPGVSQDSSAAGSFHIRNEHANAQYRINGIQLPDGVGGFASVIETSFIGNVALVTGALPAQYGLRTAGVIDIQTRSASAEPSGSVSFYGGSRGTFTPSIEYGGVSGNTEYFFTGRFNENQVGIENPQSTYNAIHDETRQERFFSYVSTQLPENARWTMITGATVAHYEIPNNPGQATIDRQDPALINSLPAPFNTQNFDSRRVNEQQLEQNYYGVLAFQKSTAFADYQISYFSRYSSIHFTPDPINDLVFNGVSSAVSRHSFLNGFQGDSAFRVSADHTLRAGFIASGEQTYVTNASTAFTVTDAGDPGNPSTISVVDRNSKLGWILGAYIQDEWKLTDKLTLNTGVRFDQMYQFVDANQLSPRASLVYKPLDGTTLFASYARYFTPPTQAISSPTNYNLLNGTTAQADPATRDLTSPVKPERADYYDIGFTQRLFTGFEVGVDVYYKKARDLLDDGQFGAAYVLTAFNYDKAENEGVELKARYVNSGLIVYGNLAYARQVGTKITSNQFLFGADELDYIRNHYVYTDHAQRITASAGASYKWDDTTYSVDAIYGSGLRSGDFNADHLPSYTQVNIGISHEFHVQDWKPFALRFDVVNLFDEVYEIRDGSGIGVFAPQYGPRRGYFVGYSQKF